jgi:methionyl-tRNA synthetase
LFEDAVKAGAVIAAAYESRDYSEAMRGIMALADRANEYIDRMQPWTLKKQPDRQAQLLEVCTVALNLYRQLAIYLAPVLPKLAQMSGDFLGNPIQHWSQSGQPLLGVKVAKFEHLMERADMKKMQTVIEASVVADAPATAGAPATTDSAAAASGSSEPDYGQALISEPLAPECTIDDFTKVDLRVAEIIKAEEVPEAKKLLKLTISLGGQIQRTVFAGIKAAYDPQSLVGRRVIVVANLKPRTMKFGTSEAMVLAAGPGEKDVFLLSPDSGAKPGQRVH